MIKETKKELEVFSGIELEPIKHRYTCGDQYLTSVSAIKNKFKEPFNREFWSRHTASKQGMTQAEVLKMWDKKRLIGTTRGTAVHEYLENKFNDLEEDIVLDPFVLSLTNEEKEDYFESLQILKQHCDNFIEDHKHLLPIKSEVIVGDLDLLIAGTFDQLFLNKETNQLEIWDFKTDSKFRSRNDYGNMMLHNLSHLDECEENLYSLQVNIYRNLILRNTSLDIPVDNMKVLWLNYGQDKYQVIGLKDLENEVNEIFEKRIYSS